MVFICTGIDTFDHALNKVVRDSKVVYYTDFLQSTTEEYDTVVLSTFLTDTDLKKLIFELRCRDKRVILLADDPDAEIIPYAFALGVYDILAGPVDVATVKNRLENPAKFSEAVRWIIGQLSDLEKQVSQIKKFVPEEVTYGSDSAEHRDVHVEETKSDAANDDEEKYSGKEKTDKGEPDSEDIKDLLKINLRELVKIPGEEKRQEDDNLLPEKQENNGQTVLSTKIYEPVEDEEQIRNVIVGMLKFMGVRPAGSSLEKLLIQLEDAIVDYVVSN